MLGRTQPILRRRLLGAFLPAPATVAGFLPPTLRAYGGTVLYLGLVAIVALGIGFVVRHTGGTVTLVLALLYLAPILTIAITQPPWREWIEQVSPMTAGLAIQATLRLDSLSISPWRGLGVLALWALGSAIAGAMAFRLRDA